MVAKKPSTLSSAPPQLTQRDVNRPRHALKAQNAAVAASPSLPSSSRKMVPQSSAHAKAKAATTVESLNKCNSCGKCVSASSSQVDAICCAKCNHVYHGRCFRPAHFVGDAASATASDRCLNCESGSYQHDLLINIKRHKSTNPLEVAARELLTKGFAVTSIGDVPRAVLEGARANVNALFSGLLLAYETALMSGATVPTLETGYTNFRQRGLGRYEMIAPEITVPFFQALCGPGTPLRDLIDLVLPPLTCPAGSLGPLTDVVEFASGIIYSTSGAAGQNWHTDGPAVSDVAEATLPYAVNIFVPLIDMGPVNGTQFVEGSQCPLFATKDGQPETRVSPEVRLGEAMLFDYRVLHRGLPNQGSLPRPCMYITFARRWYRGDMNFSKSRYRGHLKPFATTTSTRGAKN